MKFPRPSPSVFAYYKRSKTGGVEGLGTRLTSYSEVCHSVAMAMTPLAVSNPNPLWYGYEVTAGYRQSQIVTPV